MRLFFIPEAPLGRTKPLRSWGLGDRRQGTDAFYSVSVLYLRFVPLPKSARASRIKSNADVYDFELAEEDMKKIDSLDQGKEGSVSWNPVDAP